MNANLDSYAPTLDRTLSALRGYGVSNVIMGLIESGLLDKLEAGIEFSALRRQLGNNEELAAMLVNFLRNEEIVEAKDRDLIVLSAVGQSISKSRGWFRLLVGGYAPVYRDLVNQLRPNRHRNEIRNLDAVAQGSGEISLYDAGPLALSLIKRMETKIPSILDLGCGNCGLLSQILTEMPGSRGVGVDPSLDALSRARQVISTFGLEDRISLVQGDIVGISEIVPEPSLILIAFALQEVLGQKGSDWLLSQIRSTLSKWPNAFWLVIEVDFQPGQNLSSSDYGLGYYNQYFLLHELTRQRLQRRDRWKELLHDTGLRVVDEELVDPRVDPTGLLFGLLLRPELRPSQI